MILAIAALGVASFMFAVGLPIAANATDCSGVGKIVTGAEFYDSDDKYAEDSAIDLNSVTIRLASTRKCEQ